MATDKKISQLSSGAPAQAGDEYVVARSGANYKLTLTNIAANMPATTVASGDLIVSSGNVGIGTTSFSAIYSGSSTITMNNVLSNANGDLLGLVCTVSGAGPYIDFCSVNSASNRYRYAAISMLPTTTTAASESGALLFHTANAGGNISERMRIDSSGNVGIGGTAEAYARVNIQGTLPTSSNTSVGFFQAGTVPSGSTSAAYCFHTNLNTQAASFTCANFYHYSAYQNTIGAGSTVTNQYGYFADATLTGATNNYGFYSNIASGSNRWNFYAAGTADNYFAGNVLINRTTTVGNAKFAFNASSTSNSDYAIWIGDSGGTRLFGIDNAGGFSTGVAGNSPYNSTTGNAANVVVDANGVLQRSTSSLRYKSDVADASHGLADVLKLRSVTYKGKNDGNKVFGGLIAEEVHDAGLTEFVAYDKEGRPDALHYGNMVALLVKAVQELSAKVAALEAK